jgi:hypothetical protein
MLFGFAFTVLVCYALGWPLVNRLPVYKEERWPLAFVLGSAILSGIVFLLCVVHQARRGVFLAIGIAAILIAWRTKSAPKEPFLALKRGFKTLFLALFVPLSVLYLANAMAPEMSPDGSSYHLGWVAKYASNHGFTPPTTIYGMLSQGVELLFLVAFVFGKHSAAAMVHLSFLFNLIWLMVCFGRRIRKPNSGLAAAIFVFASPVVGIDGSSAYNDMALACIGFALFYLVWIWDSQRTRLLLICAGLLGGFMYATKYTGAILAIWAAGIVLWRSRDKARDVAVISLMTLVLSVPWMIRNAVHTGNPVAPFFNRVFPNPAVHVLFEKQYSEWLASYDVQNKWELPLEVTIRGDKTAGVLGHLFLLSPLALLALRRKEGRWLLGVAAVALLPYPMNLGTRFLLPAIPFISIALAMSLEIRYVLPLLMLAHSVLAWPHWPPGLLEKAIPGGGWKLTGMPWKAALGREKEDDFLRFRSEGYRRARLIESLVPPGGRVLALNGISDAYTSREILVSYQSASNEKFLDILQTGSDDTRWPRLIWKFQLAGSKTVRRFKIEQTFATKVPEEQWSVTEVRVLRDGSELPRASGWRLTAQPNPWDIQMAFDNSPVTRWRSWETARPGMFVEVDFGQTETITEIVVETSWDNPNCRVRLLVDSGDGRWQDAGVTASMEERSVKYWMRREATLELLERGVGYLLFTPDEYPGKELGEAPKEWGVTQIGEEGGARLFRIEGKQ